MNDLRFRLPLAHSNYVRPNPQCWLAVVCAVLQAFAGDSPGSKVDYVGGTLPQVRSRSSGRIYTSHAHLLVLKTKASAIEVPYERINLLEYGQQAGRRYVLALAISPLLLLSKSRKHFLTVSYQDADGRQQAMVFQVDKGSVRGLLAALEARTGLKVEYQDNEARKVGGG